MSTMPENIKVTPPPSAMKPTARQWLFHSLLFIATAVTTTIAGILFAGGDPGLVGGDMSSAGLPWSLLMVPVLYVKVVIAIIGASFHHPQLLLDGLKFSGALLAILTAHESGHYVCCRYYGVEATLPFFIPQPPLLWPGTFGAFIRMKSPVPSRRALFDIGLAGPLAGFAVILPVAFAGILTLKQSAPFTGDPGGGIYFNDPLLFRMIAWSLGINLANSAANAFYLAAWFGALVTALNLMPVGQLDGGHGTFAVFGRAGHYWISRGVFVAMAALSVLGMIWHSSPAYLVFLILLLVMLRVGHPQPQQMEPLGPIRIATAVITVIVFALCFLPVPIIIT